MVFVPNGYNEALKIMADSKNDLEHFLYLI